MIIYGEIIIQMAFILLPIMLVAVVAGIAGNMFQFGLLFTAEPLKFDLKKIDPIKGLKRIFSIRAIIELLKSTPENLIYRHCYLSNRLCRISTKCLV